MRPVLAACLGLVALGLVAAPAFALSCMYLPFRTPGERFGTKELVAHVEVLEVRSDRSMLVRVLRVFHGREERPLLTVDAASVFAWGMSRQWGLEPFSRGSEWVIVMLPARGGRGAWQPQLCRAFLKFERGTVEGYVNVLGTREVVTLEIFAHSFQ